MEHGTPAADSSVGGLEDGTIGAGDLDGLDVFVFVTHSHSDHYDPAILEWERNGGSVEYFFGWAAGNDPTHHYLVGPRATAEVDGMQIYTINSHHSGVAEVAYLDHFSPKYFFPMHNGGTEEESAEFASVMTERGYATHVPVSLRRGDRWEIGRD